MERSHRSLAPDHSTQKTPISDQTALATDLRDLNIDRMHLIIERTVLIIERGRRGPVFGPRVPATCLRVTGGRRTTLERLESGCCPR